LPKVHLERRPRHPHDAPILEMQELPNDPIGLGLGNLQLRCDFGGREVPARLQDLSLAGFDRRSMRTVRGKVAPHSQHGDTCFASPVKPSED
jgi:hypothetical protein